MNSVRTSVRATLISTAVAIIMLFGAAPVAAYTPPDNDDVAWLYKPSTVAMVDLKLPPSSIDALRADGRTYVPGTFKLTSGRKRFGPWAVEVRLKGRWGSGQSIDGKAAFKIKFPNSRQRVGGMKKLTLNNMVQDGSYITETISYELFRGMGVPAPRTGYAVVSVNGLDYGLHLNVETPDDRMFSKWFPNEATKHLYEGSYGCCYNWRDPYDDNHFDVDEGDPADRSDLVALIDTLNLEGLAWRQAMEKIADLRELTAMWAVELYVGHWDGYAWTVNNYFIHNTKRNRITMHPWGLDQTLGASGPLPFSGQGFGGGNLLDRCLTDVVCSGYFSDAVLATRAKALALALDARTATVFAAISPYIEADTRGAGLGSATWWRDRTIEFLQNRPSQVQEWYLPVSPPVNLAVIPGAVSALLSWGATDQVFGVSPSGYLVEYKGSRDRAWKALEVLNPSVTGIRVSGLASGRYEFRVSTFSSRGTSAATSAVIGELKLAITTYASCAAMNNQYDLRAGVSKSFGTRNKGVASYGSPLASSALYRANQKLDLDRDGIACEATTPLP